MRLPVVTRRRRRHREAGLRARRFTVERQVRGKWVGTKRDTLVQAPVLAHIIDKGSPTTGLSAQVLVAKYQDHPPLYRQEHNQGGGVPRAVGQPRQRA